MSRLKKVFSAALVSGALLTTMASPALAFHHGFIPASECAAVVGASNNPTARAALITKNPQFNPPLPPFNTAGQQAAGTAADEQC